MIKSGGENVYPAEIERVLLQIPGVARGLRRAPVRCEWGEVPVAFVAHEAGTIPTTCSSTAAPGCPATRFRRRSGSSRPD